MFSYRLNLISYLANLIVYCGTRLFLPRKLFAKSCEIVCQTCSQSVVVEMYIPLSRYSIVLDLIDRTFIYC